VWWNVEVFVESGLTGIGSGPNSGDSGNGGSGSGKGSPYSKLPVTYLSRYDHMVNF